MNRIRILLSRADARLSADIILPYVTHVATLWLRYSYWCQK